MANGLKASEVQLYLPLCAVVACGAAISLAQGHTRPGGYVLAACAIFTIWAVGYDRLEPFLRFLSKRASMSGV